MKINKTLSLISGVMLLLAILSIWPYGYYILLRWLTTIVGISNAYQCSKLRLQGWNITMIIVALLFNPIVPVTIGKGTWILIDLVVAFLMFVISTEFKENKHE